MYTVIGDICLRPPAHKDFNCPRVKLRIECPYCGYSASEARLLLPIQLYRKEVQNERA